MEATTSSNAKLLAPTDFKSERKPSANVLRSPKVQSHGDPDFRKQHVRIPPSPRPNRRLETKKFHSNSPSTDKACEVETIIPQSSAHPKFSPSTFCQSLPEAPRRLSVSTTDSSLSFENKSDSSSPHVESWLPRAQGSPVTNTLLPSWSLRPDPISSEASEESREWNFLNHVSPRSKLGNAPNQQISTRSQGINNSIVSTKPFPNIHAKPGTSPTDFLQREHNSAASPPSSTDLESSPPSSTFARLLHAQSDHGISLTSVGSSKSNYSTDDVSFAELRSKQPSSSPATQTAFRINPPAIVHRSATSDHLSKSFYTHNHGSPSTLEDRRELLRLRQQLAHKHDLDLQQEDLKKNTNFETDSRRGRLKGILHRRGSDPPVISTDIVKRISKPAPDCSRSDAMPYANSSSMSSVLTGKPSIAPRFLRRSPCPDAFPSAAFSPPYSPSSAPSGAAPKAAALLGIPPSQESRLSAFNISSSQADIHNSVYVSQKHLKGTSPYVSESREEKRNRVSRINRWLGAVAPSPNEGKFRVSENNLEDSFYLKSIDHEQSKSCHLDNDGGRLSNKSHKEHESLRFRKYNEVPSSSANAHTMQGHMRSTLNPERTSVQDSKANELNIPNRLKNQIYPNTFGEPPSTHYLTHDASTRTRIVPKQIHPIHENSGQLSVSSVYSTSLDSLEQVTLRDPSVLSHLISVLSEEGSIKSRVNHGRVQNRPSTILSGQKYSPIHSKKEDDEKEKFEPPLLDMDTDSEEDETEGKEKESDNFFDTSESPKSTNVERRELVKQHQKFDGRSDEKVPSEQDPSLITGQTPNQASIPPRSSSKEDQSFALPSSEAVLDTNGQDALRQILSSIEDGACNDDNLS